MLTIAPHTQYVEITQTARFTAMVDGTGKENFSYQWKYEGSDISGETVDTLKITNTTESHCGRYECIIRNEYGDSETSSAFLIVISQFYNYILYTVAYPHSKHLANWRVFHWYYSFWIT